MSRVKIIEGSAAQWITNPAPLAYDVAEQMVGPELFDPVARMAATYDAAFGGDDAFAGCAMTCFLAGFPGGRERGLVILLAIDLLRHSDRTLH